MSARLRFPLLLVAVLCASALPAGPAAAETGGATPAALAGGASTATPAPKQAPPRRTSSRPLKRGAHGHGVRVLQDLLTRAGFPTPVVGVFGPLTERNVKAFERSQGLRADGIATARLIARLRRAVAALATPVPQTQSPSTPTGTAVLRADGTAVPPADAPDAVKAVIAAANRIASTPYLWGGGHARWDDRGYDCSGSVSYALHGGGLLDFSSDSSGLVRYGDPGPGRWITLYSNPDHVYMVVAGLRYDTSGANPSRWQTAMRSGEGFVVRHPVGY
jgi:peptidoglycan hydrolase-like protein with peptidoglycan-binding domain